MNLLKILTGHRNQITPVQSTTMVTNDATESGQKLPEVHSPEANRKAQAMRSASAYEAFLQMGGRFSRDEIGAMTLADWRNEFIFHGRMEAVHLYKVCRSCVRAIRHNYRDCPYCQYGQFESDPQTVKDAIFAEKVQARTGILEQDWTVPATWDGLYSRVYRGELTVIDPVQIVQQAKIPVHKFECGMLFWIPGMYGKYLKKMEKEESPQPQRTRGRMSPTPQSAATARKSWFRWF